MIKKLCQKSGDSKSVITQEQFRQVRTEAVNHGQSGRTFEQHLLLCSPLFCQVIPATQHSISGDDKKKEMRKNSNSNVNKTKYPCQKGWSLKAIC